MKGTEQCGYVIRYGSFRRMVLADSSGNNRGVRQSLFWLSGFSVIDVAARD